MLFTRENYQKNDHGRPLIEKSATSQYGMEGPLPFF